MWFPDGARLAPAWCTSKWAHSRGVHRGTQIAGDYARDCPAPAPENGHGSGSQTGSLRGGLQGIVAAIGGHYPLQSRQQWTLVDPRGRSNQYAITGGKMDKFVAWNAFGAAA